MASISNGILYIVATPIGNLQDLSMRAQTILQTVDLILAEDTRHSRPLLDFLGIVKPLQALHEHNERQVSPKLLARLQQGAHMALITDAGTPTVSDPGRLFIELVHQHQLSIVPIPGPSALITALSVAGLPADRFVFEGFLPAKTQARQQRLQQLADESRTLVFYEAPHRILACLSDMSALLGADRVGVIAKELTKVFETIHRDTLAGLYQWLTTDPQRQKGEFVLVVQGAAPKSHPLITDESIRILNILRQQLPLKQAAKLTSDITGISKNALYRFGVEHA